MIQFADKAEGTKASSGRLRLLAHIASEGLHLEYCYHDSDLETPDNELVPWFVLSEAALMALAGRPLRNEADARAIARVNAAGIRSAIEKWLRDRGLSSIGGRPRVLLSTDLC